MIVKQAVYDFLEEKNELPEELFKMIVQWFSNFHESCPLLSLTGEYFVSGAGWTFKLAGHSHYAGPGPCSKEQQMSTAANS